MVWSLGLILGAVGAIAGSCWGCPTDRIACSPAPITSLEVRRFKGESSVGSLVCVSDSRTSDCNLDRIGSIGRQLHRQRNWLAGREDRSGDRPLLRDS